MLRAGHKVDARIGVRREIALAVDRGVDERSGAPVILVGAVGVESPRRDPSLFRARQQAIGEAGLRVALGLVAEGEQVGGVEKVEVGPRVAGRLREAVAEAAASGAADVRPDAVEDAAALLVLVEPGIEEGAQEAAALRGAKRDRPPDAARLAALLQIREKRSEERRVGKECRL